MELTLKADLAGESGHCVWSSVLTPLSDLAGESGGHCLWSFVLTPWSDLVGESGDIVSGHLC